MTAAIKYIWFYVKWVVFVGLPVVGAIVTASLWVERNIIESNQTREETEQIILEKVDAISRDVSDIRQTMVTKNDLLTTEKAIKSQTRAETDFIIRHINDPIEQLQQDIDGFRNAWDADQLAKKNLGLSQIPQISE